MLQPDFIELKQTEDQGEHFSLLPFGIVVAMHALAFMGVFFLSWSSALWFLGSFYLFGIFGASVTLHHYLSHRSFEFRHRWVKFFFLTLATWCLQGGSIYWAAHHRYHHRFSEQYRDPHSRRRGFWWSHILWLFYKNPNGCQLVSSYKGCQDLLKDPLVRWFEQHYFLINLVSLVGFLLACGYFELWEVFFAIGPMRVVAVWHATWLINSYAHGMGGMGVSGRSWAINLMIPGEGEHAAHHFYPQLNKASYLLKTLRWLQLIQDRSSQVIS